jgi:hypothetical protein
MRQTQRDGGRPGSGPGGAEAFAAIASLLWTERESLELVLFKLVQEQLILSSGQTRWLHRVDAEVAEALHRMRTSEVLRAAEVEGLAVLLDRPIETTLAELAEIAPEPWPLVLTEHRTALRALVFEIEAAVGEVRSLLNAGASAIRQTLDTISRAAARYNARGAAVDRDFGSLLLDAQA